MKRFFAALAALLGLSHGLSAAETCLDAGGSQNLVQTAVRALKGTGSDIQRNQTGVDVSIDVNGRLCSLCGMPLPERTDRSRRYVQRSDCGNQSLFEHPENKKKPLVQFTRAANGNQPETSAWCELNSQKVCADTLYNKDVLYQAKSIDIRLEPVAQKYDPLYCEQNGWLTDDYRALQHDFEGMKVKADEFCNSRREVWENMTLDDMVKVYYPSKARGSPTLEEGQLIGSWTCAMGSALCDIGYCAYTYCRKADGSFGIYDDCEGWDPVKGMPQGI
mmetsp:Transcript_45084/g.98120  ORF Transcript_45084/g.98120 Transcript_45084/m.98120 type:complete len:276 (-) Transcript_45084:52-879(-)